MGMTYNLMYSSWFIIQKLLSKSDSSMKMRTKAIIDSRHIRKELLYRGSTFGFILNLNAKLSQSTYT